MSSRQSLTPAVSTSPVLISFMSNGRIFVTHFRDIAFGCAYLIHWDRPIEDGSR